MINIEYNEGWKYPVHATLNVTDACNMRCRYCFAEKHPHTMKLETAKKTVDWVVSNYKKQIENNWFGLKPYECSIYFFGGEPTIEFYTVIEPTVKYCQQQYPDIIFHFGLTTNGLLLNDYMINFFKYYGFSFLLSIDGIKQVQDYNRPLAFKNESSFDAVVKNIKKVAEALPYSIIRGTVIPATCEYLFASYLFFEQCGFRRLFFAPNLREEWPEDKKNIVKEQMRKIFHYRTNQYLMGITPVEFSKIDYTYEQILQYDLKYLNKNFYDIIYKDFHDTPIRCGIGLGDNGVSIGFDGNIYGCQEQPTHEKNIFFIRDIYNGINPDLHLQLINTVNNSIYQPSDIKKCEKCFLNVACKKTHCISAALSVNNNFDLAIDYHCEWDQMMCNECIIQMNILVEKNCETFKKYLKEIPTYKNIIQQEKGEKNVNTIY